MKMKLLLLYQDIKTTSKSKFNPQKNLG